MNLFRNLFRKKIVEPIKTDNNKELLDKLISRYKNLEVNPNCFLTTNINSLDMYTTNISKTLKMLHTCIHIIRSKNIFSERFINSLLSTTTINVDDYLTDEEGYWYTPTSIIEEILEKLTTIHNLIEDSTPDIKPYYLFQIDPLLRDIHELYFIFV